MRVETTKPSSDAGFRSAHAFGQTRRNVTPASRQAHPSVLSAADLAEARLHIQTARLALGYAFRLLSRDSVLGIAAETAGKAASRVLESLNARLEV